jgi:hypothetical protein
MDARTAIAAAIIDNAKWCHLVCATHGITGRFDPDAWVSPRRTPPGYPDAVTLTADVSPETLLSRIDRGAGCSVKDSFRTLDLTAAGFEVLFDAEWIFRAAFQAADRGGLAWERVERPDDLSAWSDDHGGGSTLSAAHLDEPSVAVLAGRDRHGRRVAGAIATEGDVAVGISNVFATDATRVGRHVVSFADAVSGATAAIGERYPGRPIVGYLTTGEVDAARAAGFETVGPLRVWLREGS